MSAWEEDNVTNGMNDEQLIGYCEIHCETPRALFNGKQVKRMLALAGELNAIEEAELQLDDDDWLSIKGDMRELCEKARKNLKGEGNETTN